MTKVSIIIPVYNTEKYLSRCLDSVFKQTLTDIEIIIVDDGSTDNSHTIYNTYSNRQNYHIIQKQNGGLSSAREIGLKSATGDYVLFIDSDDYINPNMCEYMYNACETNNCNMCICAYNTVDSKGSITPHKLCYNTNIISNEQIQDYYTIPLIAHVPSSRFNVPSFLWLRMMKRSIITPNCFVNENIFFMEDLVFNLSFVTKISRIAIINIPLYNYCYNNQSLTTKVRKNAWQMRCNLYRYCDSYLKLHNITCNEAKKRLFTHKYAAILYSIQNNSKLSYSKFKQSFQTIISDPILKGGIYDVFSKYFRFLSINYKLLYFLLLTHPFLIYKFYNWRQHR